MGDRIDGYGALTAGCGQYGSKDYDENLANVVWKSNYYLSLFLTWVACPLAVAYLNSDAFTTRVSTMPFWESSSTTPCF